MAYVTLPTFVSCSSSAGAKRATLVRRQRRMYDNPEPSGFDFYRRAAAAIRTGREADMDAAAMDILVANATPRSAPHYQAVAEGWLRYLGRRKPAVLGVGRGRWRCGGLEVGITPQFGLRSANGQDHAVHLYFKEELLTKDAAHLALRLMELRMKELLPSGGEPMVLDVRRAKAYTLGRRDRDRLDHWIRSEAAAFLTLWEPVA
ncbi:hypothetical protein [Amycolatopsis magusensis]|uniref:hypothetical protein n=1 Tax=Amycolatopsis magusensis TaxID=882444 RepID=UPI003C2E077E